MFPNGNGDESSPTGKNCNKISNFSNFPQKSETGFYLCDSTHV